MVATVAYNNLVSSKLGSYHMWETSKPRALSIFFEKLFLDIQLKGSGFPQAFSISSFSF